MGSCYKHVDEYVTSCTGMVLEIGSDRKHAKTFKASSTKKL